MSDYANMLESIRGLASSLHTINQKAVREYTPVVEAILRSPIPDARNIVLTKRGRYAWVVLIREFFTAVNNFRDYCRGEMAQ
jgi:hypothetical protein